jgi:hypothetical protein
MDKVELSWGKTTDEVISFEEAEPSLDRIFEDYANPEGLEVRYRRYLWKAVIPG